MWTGQCVGVSDTAAESAFAEYTSTVEIGVGGNVGVADGRPEAEGIGLGRRDGAGVGSNVGRINGRADGMFVGATVGRSVGKGDVDVAPAHRKSKTPTMGSGRLAMGACLEPLLDETFAQTLCIRV